MPSNRFIFRPPAYYVLEVPSPTSGRTKPGSSGLNIKMAQWASPHGWCCSQRMARLSCTLALLLYVFSFVTLSDFHLFISGPRFCACSVYKWIINSPDKRPKRSALSPHPPTIAHGITIRDCMLTPIHHLCLFFTSKHPARIPTGTDNNIQRERKSKRLPEGTADLRGERILFGGGMGGMEAVLFKPECHCSLQWAWAVGAVETA